VALQKKRAEQTLETCGFQKLKKKSNIQTKAAQHVLFLFFEIQI
jgi:hypothetical protein